MPEPVLLVLGGIALYKLFKGGAAPASNPPDIAITPAGSTAGATPIGTGQAGTTPGSPLATPTSIANQGTAPLAIASTDAIVVPGDLVVALDNDTAMKMRAYAALNPEDFQVFLNRYADRLVLRNDLYMDMLTNGPGDRPIELTPGMMIGLGTSAYKVAQAINGVSAGKSVDVFGISASVAGQIPGVNQDFVSSLQGLTLGYRAITSIQQVMSIAAANQVGVTTLMSWGTSSIAAVGAYPGLVALPLAGVLMAVGLVVDIGFTIMGDAPDLQKAIDVALDVASLAVLFIPIIGIVIAVIIQLVKFIIDLFGEALFGGGMTHEQREVIETARYGENLNPMFSELANAYTPRELQRVIEEWGTGYCGGRNVVAIAISLVLFVGDVVPINGRAYTVPADVLLTYPAPGCYTLPAPYNQMSRDDLAWAVGAYASVNGVVAVAQAGIVDWRKEQFNDPTEKLIMARATTMRKFLVDYNITLDQCDMIAMEYRAQPHLAALAESFGWTTWQELFASIVNDEWQVFNWTVSHGSLSDFAKQNGYPTMYAFRAAALAPWESYYARVSQARQRLAERIAAEQVRLEQAIAV